MAIRFLNKQPAVQQLSDEELVSKFSATQQQTYFEELYRRYKHLAYGVCLKLMKNEDESRDVVSDVFKILFVKLPTSEIKSFKAYLYTVSRNECIAKLRQKKSEMEKLAKYNHVENSPTDFMENDGFAALFSAHPTMEQEVERAVEQLGDEQKTCIRLFFYDDKSYREIATETGFTEKQVKSYLQNGKRNLRILLEKELRKRTT
ncbi:MAG: sigma-70 family RNA polymerase sigma factor [Bacteroidetes bacterium]|nr:sigma-70 family RNA polymerase sigma factor [Bacteroidota bacterium]